MSSIRSASCSRAALGTSSPRRSTKPRTYRVSNIKKLDVLDDAVRRPPRFDLSKFCTTSAKDFETRLMRERATVRITAQGLRILRDINPAAAATVKMPVGQEGWLKTEIPVEGAEHAARQLLRLGTDVEILEPLALREAVSREASAIARLYR